MFSPYRGRCHTKKQANCKTKLSVAERKARIARKKLEKLFPGLPYHWLAGKHKSIYQHSITKKRIAV